MHLSLVRLSSGRDNLQSVVNRTHSIVCSLLPSVNSIFTVRCIIKAGNIVKDACHSGHSPFPLLPSGRRCRGLKARTSKLKNNVFPTAIGCPHEVEETNRPFHTPILEVLPRTSTLHSTLYDYFVIAL